ncbi:hypothetical protein [Inquilinus sp.]|jgi:hypothetical protein|uniref:hypothetical protein n=1 Tax=Inquilinus sp. TaxID=1932117 RepID=UPI0037840ABF
MTDITASLRRFGVARALRRATLPLALLAVLAGCNSTTPPGAASPATTAGTAGSGLMPQTSPEIQRIEALGRTIYVLDNAAARATDLAFAQGADLRATDMRGWVTDTSGPGVLVRFIRQKGDRFEAAYDVTVDESGQAVALARPANPTLTPDQASQFAARQLVTARALPPLCPGPYAPVVFRDPASPSDWRVYLLAATTDPQVKVYAGHQRYRVSGDGLRILSSEQLSKSCLAPRLAPPPGQTPQFFVMTELQSPTPIETHVFDNFLYRLPILVVTVPEKQKWAVLRGRLWRME